jgi:hypothetical protein
MFHSTTRPRTERLLWPVARHYFSIVPGDPGTPQEPHPEQPPTRPNERPAERPFETPPLPPEPTDIPEPEDPPEEPQLAAS